MSSRGTTFAAGTKMHGGLLKHQVSLNIVHIGGGGLTPAVAFKAALDQAQLTESAYQQSRQLKSQAVEAQTIVRTGVEQYCLKARDVLKPFLGRSWNNQWTAPGFKNQTLSLPGSLADLTELTRSLKQYFINHSPQESFSAEITANLTGAQLTGLETAVKLVSDRTQAQRVARDARDEAEQVLLGLTGKLRSELDAAMEPDDARWLDFLDALPSDTQVPEPVTNLEVEAAGPGRLEAGWTRSARAERFHLEVLEAGRDVEFRRVLTTQDANANLDMLTPGGRYKIRVTPVNRAGAGVSSEVVDIQVPALENVA